MVSLHMVLTAQLSDWERVATGGPLHKEGYDIALSYITLTHASQNACHFGNGQGKVLKSIEAQRRRT